MAEKVYLTHKPSLSVSREIKDEATGEIRHIALFFTNGRLVTKDAEAQKYLEGLPSFGRDITLEDNEIVLAGLAAEAKRLRVIADAAVAAADAAQSVFDSHDKAASSVSTKEAASN